MACHRGECGSGGEWAWPFSDVKDDLERWEGLSEGTANPWEEHGPCHKKAVMGEELLFLRKRVAEWGKVDA